MGNNVTINPKVEIIPKNKAIIFTYEKVNGVTRVLTPCDNVIYCFRITNPDPHPYIIYVTTDGNEDNKSRYVCQPNSESYLYRHSKSWCEFSCSTNDECDGKECKDNDNGLVKVKIKACVLMQQDTPREPVGAALGLTSAAGGLTSAAGGLTSAAGAVTKIRSTKIKQRKAIDNQYDHYENLQYTPDAPPKGNKLCHTVYVDTPDLSYYKFFTHKKIKCKSKTFYFRLC